MQQSIPKSAKHTAGNSAQAMSAQQPNLLDHVVPCNGIMLVVMDIMPLAESAIVKCRMLSDMRKRILGQGMEKGRRAPTNKQSDIAVKDGSMHIVSI